MSSHCPEWPAAGSSESMTLALKNPWLKIEICGLGMSQQLLVVTVLGLKNLLPHIDIPWPGNQPRQVKPTEMGTAKEKTFWTGKIF